jgi:hypothetical protein
MQALVPGRGKANRGPAVVIPALVLVAAAGYDAVRLVRLPEGSAEGLLLVLGLIAVAALAAATAIAGRSARARAALAWATTLLLLLGAALAVIRIAVAWSRSTANLNLLAVALAIGALGAAVFLLGSVGSEPTPKRFAAYVAAAVASVTTIDALFANLEPST